MNFLSKFFRGGDAEENAFSDCVCDLIIVAVSNLVKSSELKRQTRMSCVLAIPYSQQYIAGTFLSVLSYYVAQKGISHLQMKTEGVLKKLYEKVGPASRDGFRQVENLGKDMRAKGAPLPESTPEVSQAIVAEILIANVLLQGRAPEAEIEIFRRIYFGEIKELRLSLLKMSSQTNGPSEDTEDINQITSVSDGDKCIAKEIVGKSSDLCDRLNKVGGIEENKQMGEVISVLTASYIYVLTRMLSKWHSDFWRQDGQRSIKRILILVNSLYPLTESMYTLILAENIGQIEAEKEVMFRTNPLTADCPGEVQDRSCYEACANNWWRTKLSKGISYSWLNDEDWQYKISASDIYSQYLRLNGIGDSPCLERIYKKQLGGDAQ